MKTAMKLNGSQKTVAINFKFTNWTIRSSDFVVNKSFTQGIVKIT